MQRTIYHTNVNEGLWLAKKKTPRIKHIYAPLQTYDRAGSCLHVYIGACLVSAPVDQGRFISTHAQGGDPTGTSNRLQSDQPYYCRTVIESVNADSHILSRTACTGSAKEVGAVLDD